MNLQVRLLRVMGGRSDDYPNLAGGGRTFVMPWIFPKFSQLLFLLALSLVWLPSNVFAQQNAPPLM